MATSGSTSVKVTNYDTLKFTWERTSYSIANNTSTISWKMQLISTSSGRISSTARKDYTVTVNGTKYTGTNTVGIENNATKLLAEGSTTIKHNTDGSKTFSYSFSQEFAITFSGESIGTKSGSGTGTLNKLPRASTITVQEGNIEGADAVINISRSDSSFTHTLKYAFGTLSGTIVSKTTGTSYSWDLPTDFYYQIPNAKKGVGTVTCETYSGNTLIGTSTASFTANTLPLMVGPGVNPTIEDINAATVALTGDYRVFVKGESTASVAMGVSVRKGATLVSKSFKNNNKTYTEDTTIANVTSGTFEFEATDSRNYIRLTTEYHTVIDYIKPTCHLNMIASIDGVATVNISGNYFNGSFGKASNTLSVQYRYKESGGSYGEWINAATTLNGNTYTATATVSGLEYQQSYVFQTRAVDKLNTINSAEKAVKALPVFDWSGTDFNFNVPVYLNDKLLRDYVIEEGTVDNWNYRKWNSGVMEGWYTANVATAVSTQYGSGFYNGGTPYIDIPSGMFKNKPTVMLAIEPSNAQIYSVHIAALSTTRLTYYITSMQSQASSNMRLQVYAYGHTEVE